MIIEALSWIPATVTEIRDEARNIKTFRLQTTAPYSFLAGQHTIVRVTLPSGFKSSRDYSFSSSPSSGVLEITVVKEPQGEVSGWLHDVCQIGTQVELTPPLGQDFVWTPQSASSLLVAGGIGVAPFLSMLREHRAQQSSSPIRLLYNARDIVDICVRDELQEQFEDMCEVIVSQPLSPWSGRTGRINLAILKQYLEDFESIYLCGSYGFVTDIKKLLQSDLEVDIARIKTEQFN